MVPAANAGDEEGSLEVRPGPEERTVIDRSGSRRRVPADWALLEPGDAAATRRVKKAGPHWIVKVERRRRMVSLGVWAPAATIDSIARDLEAERADPSYQRRLDQGRARRAREQEAYVETFEGAVRAFLAAGAARLRGFYRQDIRRLLHATARRLIRTLPGEEAQRLSGQLFPGAGFRQCTLIHHDNSVGPFNRAEPVCNQ